MTIRRQDLSVLVFHLLGYSRIRNLIFRMRRQPVARFVTFHHVPPHSIARFEANLRFLKKRTNVVSLDDFMHGRLSADRTNVVLTFDDGYKSWVTDVAPILKRLGLPAIFFVASGFVGLSREDGDTFMRTKLLLSPDRDAAASGLSEAEVRSLVDDGFAIGGHTVNHCNLNEVRGHDRLMVEIAEDKRRLQEMTGSRIDYFAYPFGVCRNPEIDLENVLRECGYLGAVTTVSGGNVHDTNSYFLHRELTPASMSEWVFRARVYGNYDAVRFLKRPIS